MGVSDALERATIDNIARPDPVCVVPKRIAPGRGHSKLQGAHTRPCRRRLGLRSGGPRDFGLIVDGGARPRCRYAQAVGQISMAAAGIQVGNSLREGCHLGDGRQHLLALPQSPIPSFRDQIPEMP